MKEFVKSHLRRVVAFVTREVLAEMDRRGKSAQISAKVNLQPTAAAPAASDGAHSNALVKIDVVSALRELAKPEANAALQAFYSGNHRFVALLAEMNQRAAADTQNFVEAEMPSAMYVNSQFRFISAKRDQILERDGSILDLGVYKGGSTRELAKIFPNETIHGFDSFEGLPSDWTHALKGSFGEVRGVLPNMPDNVRLYKGWFDDTLPEWIKEHSDKPISLLRVDCDIYESTKTIFNVLKPPIGPGTWIVFDELIGYRGFRHHELKAFNEFIAETNFDSEYLAFGLTYTACRLKPPNRTMQR